MSRDRFYVAHILECIRRIERYTFEGQARFMVEEMAQDAVIRNLQILAESTQKISEAVKVEHPDVEWRAIAGFRNVLVHDYLGLDVEEVWSIVATDLPRLRTQMEAIAVRLEPPGQVLRQKP